MARSADPSVAALWRQRLNRFRSSSLSVARFCRREGISTASFYHWQRNLAGKISASPAAAQATSHPSAFQPVTLVASAPALAVRLPGGTQLEVPAANVELVRVVVRELAQADQACRKEGAAC